MCYVRYSTYRYMLEWFFTWLFLTSRVTSTSVTLHVTCNFMTDLTSGNNTLKIAYMNENI